MEKLIMLTLKFKANLRSSMSDLLAFSAMTTMVAGTVREREEGMHVKIFLAEFINS